MNKNTKTSRGGLSFLLLIIALWTIAGTACNTVRGIGRDVENAGEGIERAAQ